MPISRREFESGEPDPTLVIAEFLRSNPDYAYTLEELIVYMASKRIALTVEEVRDILSSLEAQERVESKMIHGVVYYGYKKAIGFRPS